MPCFWIWFVWVFHNESQAQRIHGLLSIYRLNLFSCFYFFVFHVSVLERLPLILRYSRAAVPCALPPQPWRLTLVNRFAGGTAPIICSSCLLGCWAGEEAVQPRPFFLPLIPDCNSALTIYTELASGGPSWDQDPAVLATGHSRRLSSLQKACAVSGEAIVWSGEALLLLV